MRISRRDFLQIMGGTVAGTAFFVAIGKTPVAAVERPPFAIAGIDSCVRCFKCVEICPPHAIVPATMLDGIENAGTPKFVGGCIGCLKCIEVCPSGVLVRVIAAIELERCIRCLRCMQACPFDAITHTNRLPSVIADKCTGCSVCVDVCPRDIIHVVRG